MIFASVNEDGVPAWKQVLSRVKTVTRRLKPLAVGKEFAVQPGRGKKSVCRAVVVSCLRHDTWRKQMLYRANTRVWSDILLDEARLEGFVSYNGLLDWLESKNVDADKTYRIEFELVWDYNGVDD